MTGTFITFEGPEGAGKTTQIELLAATLRDCGQDVLVTREPGGTKAGEKLRELLLDSEMDWSPLAEALLMNAARDVHMREVILPALSAEKTVLCDRFCHSTRAYQGGGGGLDTALLRHIETAVCEQMPNLTLIFDLPPEEGLARAAKRGRADRFEAKGEDYHRRVADAFRAMAADEPTCILIDATGTVEDVTNEILAAVRKSLPHLLDQRP